MYNSYGVNTFNAVAGSAIWIVVSLVLAIIGGIVIYFVFLKKQNEDRFTGFLGWCYSFLSFKKFFAEVLLKIGYLILAIYVTLSSFALIGTNFLGFLLYLIIGNIVVRIIYEFLLIALVTCRNTTEINQKLSTLTKTSKPIDHSNEPKE